jgi:hypothetical protein
MMTLSFFSLLSFASDEAEAIGVPIVTVKFDEGYDTQLADVRPGEHGTVTFPGTVRAQIPAGSTIQQVVVDLQASTAMGWPAIVNPPQVQVNPGAESPFSVSVTVPPETSYTISDTVSVTGRGNAYPGALGVNVQPVQGIINVDQFYKFAIVCEKNYQEVSPTDQLMFSITIWNYGNGPDTYIINLPNADTLSKDGWNIQMGQYNVEVLEKSPAEVSVTVNTPVKFNHWINEVKHIMVEVKSEQQEAIEGNAFPKTYPLAVRQRGFSLPGFDPILVIMSFVFITIFVGRRHQIKTLKTQRTLRKISTLTTKKR